MMAKQKKILNKLICAGIVILAIAGCAKATLVDSNSIVVDDIEYYIQTNKSVYNLGENVEMLYRVTNISENPVDIGMVINCAWAWSHFVITDDDNNEIWQYLHGPPPCGWIMLHLEPDEFREYQKTWDMMNDNGTYQHDDDFPVGPGSYNIMAELELDGGYERVPVSVSIEIIPEPATVLLLGFGGLLLRKCRLCNKGL